jgi:hypothetical protein
VKPFVKSGQDFWTGLAFVAFGLVTAWLASGYQLGTAARMGPGYFPLLLGAMLAVIGAIIVARSLVSAAGGGVTRINLWLVGRLLLSLVAFALLLAPFGLIIAAFVAILVAAWAGPEFRFLEGAAAALVLSVSAWLIFVLALKQTMPVWPTVAMRWLGL